MKNLRSIFFIFTLTLLFGCSAEQGPSDVVDHHDSLSNINTAFRINKSSLRRDSVFEEIKQQFLHAYSEKELKNETIETYRFIWINPLRNGAVPSALFRIQYNSDSLATLTIKYANKGTISSSEKQISSKQWQDFLFHIRSMYFWSLEQNDPSSASAVPTYWYLEGLAVSEGNPESTFRYHLVQRLSPYSSCFRQTCELLVSYAGMPALESEIKSCP